MITATTTSISMAHSIDDMQRIARNQITQKIYELEERVNHLKALRSNVVNIKDFESYERIADDCIYYGDTSDLTAVLELANEYGTMISGNYF